MEKEKNNWVSCYLFHDISFEEVLKELITPLINSLKKEKLISNFFFIRYWENGPHIRLRVQPVSKIVQQEIESGIKKAVNNYFTDKRNANHTLEFNKYIRETERYGGSASMLLSERQFHKSSEYLLNTLDKTKNWDYSTVLAEALKLHLILLKSFYQGDENEMIDCLNFVTNNWLTYSVKKIDGKTTKEEVQKLLRFYEGSYTKQKKDIGQLIKIVMNNQHEDKNLQDWQVFHTNLQKETTLLIGNNTMKTPGWMVYSEEQKINDKNKILWPWLDSLIHMTNNRLGIYLRDEAFIAFLLSSGLRDYYQKSKIESQKIVEHATKTIS